MRPSDLKPCPHCGETEHLYPAYHGHGGGKPYAIDCVTCGYDFSPREGMDVVEMWNRRFDPTDVTALVDLQHREADARLSNEVSSSILREALEVLDITDDLEIVGTIAANQSLIAKLTEALEEISDMCPATAEMTLAHDMAQIASDARAALSLAKSEKQL